MPTNKVDYPSISYSGCNSSPLSDISSYTQYFDVETNDLRSPSTPRRNLNVSKSYESDVQAGSHNTSLSAGDEKLKLLDVSNLPEWKEALAFTERRHRQMFYSRVSKLTDGEQDDSEGEMRWRMRERMKTVSVALVMCLNIGVDPPDVLKTNPCARLETWIDPLSSNPQKALENIGGNLQKQYERWQSRARYKQTLDPTVEEVKKLCTSLRKNAKEERVLFHYNGHGVPKPTVNGEIWVFNKSYTQYIPLSLYDLNQWMGSPSIYVFDCSNSGIILDSFEQFAASGSRHGSNSSEPPPDPSYRCILLGACAANQILPMNPQLPADIFTCCLTTPIRAALLAFVNQPSHGKLIRDVDKKMIESLPGRSTDRRTPLGELNWIFTAITDTIAWNVLPHQLFQTLFRQDVLVASLFRNFLLAERILRSFSCTPVSVPPMPPTFQHPLWAAWDLALDMCLSQLSGVLDGTARYLNSQFFADQLTAFEVWLDLGSPDCTTPPEQLPIVLQVLLSQQHRVRALELLCRFLDLGQWAVVLALSVGIFPYVLKLLQSSTRELKHMLIFIWAKILAVYSNCQVDLLKEGGHKYFISALSDPLFSLEYKRVAAFVLTKLVCDYPPAQEQCTQSNLVSVCLELLHSDYSELRLWSALCLGYTWSGFDAARWRGVRDSAQEKLYPLLGDPHPEVRAGVVFALGRFMGAAPGRVTEHSVIVGKHVAMTMVTRVQSDCSPLVRFELIAALSPVVLQTLAVYVSLYESTVASVDLFPVVRMPEQPETSERSGTPDSPPADSAYNSDNNNEDDLAIERVQKISRCHQLDQLASSSKSNVSAAVWRTLMHLACDPHPEVHRGAQQLVSLVAAKATAMRLRRRSFAEVASSPPPPPPPPDPSRKFMRRRSIGPISSGGLFNILATSPKLATVHSDSETVPSRGPCPASPILTPHSTHFSISRKMFDRGPSAPRRTPGEKGSLESGELKEAETAKEVPSSPETTTRGTGVGSPPPGLQSNRFLDWCTKRFRDAHTRRLVPEDPRSAEFAFRETRYLGNAAVRRECRADLRRAPISQLSCNQFRCRTRNVAAKLSFHPYNDTLAVVDGSSIVFYDWQLGNCVNQIDNRHLPGAFLTDFALINTHESDAMVLTAASDGGVRVWDGGGRGLVAAWQPFPGRAESARLRLAWDQSTCVLVVGGVGRTIRAFDARTESLRCEFPAGCDAPLSALVGDFEGRGLVVAGYADGTAKAYDFRVSSASMKTTTLGEHKSGLINVHLQRATGDGKVLTASEDGDIKLWDPRFSESVRTMRLGESLSAFEAHPRTEIFAVGSTTNRHIEVYNLAGDRLNQLRFYDDFVGQRIGAVCSLGFHPYRVMLASGTADSYVSIYSLEKERRDR